MQNLLMFSPKVHAQQCGRGAAEWKWIEVLVDTSVDSPYWPLAYWLLLGWREPLFCFLFASLVAAILRAG